MALLLLIGFLAGVVTAISPCVLPVLPVLLAGGAARGRGVRAQAGADRRRARSQLQLLHALRGVAARQARAAGGLSTQRGDRAPLRDGCDVARLRRGVAARAYARGALSVQAAGCPGRVPARRGPRARVR